MSDPRVEIVRSPRRKRTIQASFIDGGIRVLVPAGLKPEEEKKQVELLVARLTRKRETRSIDLMERARRLARRYQLPVPTTIEWSDRQMERWGSCTFSNRSIRISSRLVNMPSWVLDYVIVHELAHLAVPRHSLAFHALVGRYELGERAEGYLIAKSEPVVG
jgi:predicted metal-dependent hydrolase